MAAMTGDRDAVPRVAAGPRDLARARAGLAGPTLTAWRGRAGWPARGGAGELGSQVRRTGGAGPAPRGVRRAGRVRGCGAEPRAAPPGARRGRRPARHPPPVAGEVHQHPAPVHRVGPPVGEARVDEPVDHPGGGRRRQRGVRGDLAHAPATAPGEHQQHPPAVAADPFGRGHRRQRGGHARGPTGRVARPDLSPAAPGDGPSPAPFDSWLRHGDRLYFDCERALMVLARAILRP